MRLLLTVLRVIGILVLAVILLVLVLLLLILFCPVRYRLTASVAADEKPEAKVRVSWLLRLLSLHIDYQGKLSYCVKVLGITLFDEKKAKPPSGENGGEEESDGQTAEKGGAETAKHPQSSNPEPLGAPSETSGASSEASGASSEVSSDSSGISSEQSGDEGTGGRGPEKSEDEAPEQSPGNKILQWLLGLPEKIAALLEGWARIQENIGEYVDNFLEKADALLEKKDRVMKQINDERNRYAVKEIFRTLSLALKHIRPQKLRIDGRLGFEDPALTGQIFGIIGMLMPLYGEHIQLEAVFDQAVTEGHVWLKGRIRIGYILWLALKLIFKKEVRRLIAQMKRLKSSVK